MLEKMNDFFNKRIGDYDNHMLRDIESADVFYPFTASLLPRNEYAHVLDLGCGTGLELGYYFELNPKAIITGIDLSEEMLRLLKEKYPDKDINIIYGSYFDIQLGEACYDAVVSVESLHHFTKDEKTPLYKSVYESLMLGGAFVLTDYFARSCEQEAFFRNELLRLKIEQGISDNEFYHYDTPLTVEHECEILTKAGFQKIEVLGNWENTYTIRAVK